MNESFERGTRESGEDDSPHRWQQIFKTPLKYGFNLHASKAQPTYIIHLELAEKEIKSALEGKSSQPKIFNKSSDSAKLCKTRGILNSNDAVSTRLLNRRGIYDCYEWHITVQDMHTSLEPRESVNKRRFSRRLLFKSGTTRAYFMAI